MRNNLISNLKDFIKKEKIKFLISEDNNSEFWLDDINNSLTVRFIIDNPNHEILYDVYSPEYSVHLKEETINDVEYLELLAEENRKWKLAESIEDIWIILDQIKLWANKNSYKIMERQLI
jgi:hypothetical protein